ncbi:hypothetical protein ZWY2020_011049 [Hordeum vulgare]|nr:hypothetical protein ZWY2020_011049 [Hordeum vulgare]
MIEERKATLEEKRVKIAVNAEDADMLTWNVDSLDADARVIMQSYWYQILQWQKNELAAATDCEDAPESAEEVPYAAAITPP